MSSIFRFGDQYIDLLPLVQDPWYIGAAIAILGILEFP